MPPHTYRDAFRTGAMQVVAMNEIHGIKYGLHGRRYIGTEDLNSCTAIMILSNKAAILAHVAPRAADPQNQHQHQASGDQQIIDTMKALKKLLADHNGDFKGQGAEAVVAYAKYEGYIAWESQVKIICANLNAWGLPVATCKYDVVLGGSGGSAKGTVFVDSTHQVPAAYVEDTKIPRKSTGASGGESSKPKK